MSPTALQDLPPEILDYITTFLPNARSISNLSKTNKSLRTFVEKEAWATFNRTRFPSIYPLASPSHKDAARSLTTLSAAWDRRALVARYVEPQGDIRTFPGGEKVDKWKRPKGQTIGFTPHLDVYEEFGTRWRDRREVLAFSAGAELCVREKSSDGEKEDVRWMTYKPLSAHEGKDDVTTLKLVRPGVGDEGGQRLVVGTANGDLQLLGLPERDETEMKKSYFVTQGLAVRSSSTLQNVGGTSLLAANLGDSRISLYPLSSNVEKIESISDVDTRSPQTNGHKGKHQRVWSTQFLSSQHLAAGLGPSQEPIQIYTITPSGIDKEPLRTFTLKDHPEHLKGIIQKPVSSVYPIVALPPSSTAGSSSEGNVFLSGAYDGIIRLHDLRSNRDVEQEYVDPTDDSSIYSLLPRGQETLLAGTSRHNLLKIFDLRLGAKCYSYLDASSNTTTTLTKAAPTSNNSVSTDWNLFVKPTIASTRPTNTNNRSGWANTRPRIPESSIYSLAASSPHSPTVYVGIENTVLSLASTSITDRHQDPSMLPRVKRGAGKKAYRDVLDLAMYDQSSEMKLRTQKGVWEVTNAKKGEDVELEGLDGRWMTGS